MCRKTKRTGQNVLLARRKIRNLTFLETLWPELQNPSLACLQTTSSWEEMEVNEYKPDLGENNGAQSYQSFKKAMGLHSSARGAKFWRGDEDIQAGLTMWKVVCKPVLNYEAGVWACSGKVWGQTRNKIRKQRVGESKVFFDIAIFKCCSAGWNWLKKLKFERHSLALQYLGRRKGLTGGQKSLGRYSLGETRGHALITFVL